MSNFRHRLIQWLANYKIDDILLVLFIIDFLILITSFGAMMYYKDKYPIIIVIYSLSGISCGIQAFFYDFCKSTINHFLENKP